MYQAHLDQLTSFATAAPFQDEVMAAKRAYFEATGEVFEDDKSFERRMACFLEFYLFDRPLPGRGKSPAELFLAEGALSPADRAACEGFTRTIHSLFEVRKLLSEGVRVRDLFGGADHEVFERRTVAGLSKGDLLEARLIPFGGKLLFAPAFCYHPRAARGPVLKELKRRRKRDGASFSASQMLFTLSHMALKVERYRNIAVENIYTFDRKTI